MEANKILNKNKNKTTKTLTCNEPATGGSSLEVDVNATYTALAAHFSGIPAPSTSHSSASAESTSRPKSGSSAGGAVAPLKRGRTSTTTPPTKPEGKKPKVSSSPALSPSADFSLQVLVRDKSGRVIGKDQTNDLMLILFKMLDELPSGATRPIFEGHVLIAGALTFQCSNQHSVDWLVNSVNGLKPIGNFDLVAEVVAKVPERRKVTFSIFDPDFVRPDLLFKRFRESNPGLSTDGWIYVSRLEVNKPHGSTHLVALDQGSLDFVMQRGKHLRYMLQKVTLSIKGTYKVGLNRRDWSSSGKPRELHSKKQFQKHK